MYSSDTKYLLKQMGIDIHARYSTSPITLKTICAFFGLKYRKTSLGANTCGMLMRSNAGNFIFINENHAYVRRRFSLAHEVGHFYLGHQSDVSKLNDYSKPEEVHANKFATSLLMPDELFYYVHKESFTIKAMARWLRVSQISVAIRCLEFGIREYEAELTKSEYYLAIEEATATGAYQQKKSQQNPEQEYEWRKKDPRLTKYEQVYKQNDETLDRLRRVYGYE